MFTVAVKIDGIENRRRSSKMLHLLIGFFLLARAAQLYSLFNYDRFLVILPFLLTAAVSIFYGFFRRKMDGAGKYNGALRLLQAFSFLILGYLMWKPEIASINAVSAGVFALLGLMLYFSERTIFQDAVLIINDAGVEVPGYYRSHLVPWSDLADVTVRADFITLFHVKKKYLQFQVLQNLSTLEVAKMSAFCSERVGEGERSTMS